MKLINNSNAIFMLLVISLHGPSSTQEFHIEIPKECQHFCDSKRPKRHDGPYLLTCFDDDCSDVSCETHKCPSEICKNGRTIFCPSTKGSYRLSSRNIQAPTEAAPVEQEYHTFDFVIWAFSAFAIIGICCAAISWGSNRNKNQKKIEAFMPRGYIHSHQDEHHRNGRKGGCFRCCMEGNDVEDENYEVQHVRVKRLSSILTTEDEEDTWDRKNHKKPYSFDKVRSKMIILPETETKTRHSVNFTTESEEKPSASSISIIKPPPSQASSMKIPKMSIEIAESESGISVDSEMGAELYRSPSSY